MQKKRPPERCAGDGKEGRVPEKGEGRGGGCRDIKSSGKHEKEVCGVCVGSIIGKGTRRAIGVILFSCIQHVLGTPGRRKAHREKLMDGLELLLDSHTLAAVIRVLSRAEGEEGTTAAVLHPLPTAGASGFPTRRPRFHRACPGESGQRAYRPHTQCQDSIRKPPSTEKICVLP